MREFINVEELSFEVRRSAQCKNISIIVDRDGQLVITAPEVCSQDKLLSAVKNKKQWIYTKLIDKEKQLAPSPPIKEYVSGEGFYYLGKSYRLYIVDPNPNLTKTPALRFYQGQFQLHRDKKTQGLKYFIEWYTNHCSTWLEVHLPLYVKRLDVDIPKLHVTNLGYRWGSCSPKQVNFHWRCIMLPVHILEYVVVHELTHILHPNHSSDFWLTIERVLPDWQERKIWLAENGARYSLF